MSQDELDDAKQRLIERMEELLMDLLQCGDYLSAAERGVGADVNDPARQHNTDIDELLDDLAELRHREIVVRTMTAAQR